MLSLDQVHIEYHLAKCGRDLKENEIDVSKSLDDISENKPRTRIPLSSEILAEFEKIRRGHHKKMTFPSS